MSSPSSLVSRLHVGIVEIARNVKIRSVASSRLAAVRMSGHKNARRAHASFTRVQPGLALAAAGLDLDLPLSALAAHAGLSTFHLHHLFARVAGETPKQYTLRLRIGRGAALLLTSESSILEVALSCGFKSHEAFTRAFRRRFGMSPRAYRRRGFAAAVDSDAAAHVAFVRSVGPCLHFFHMDLDKPRGSDMTYSIVKKDLVPQAVLVVRRRVKRSDIASTIGGALPRIFQCAQQHGLALTGHPFTRYVEVGAGLLTIEPGMRVSAPQPAPPPLSAAAEATGSAPSDVVQDTLPGGPAVVTMHAGPYETLSDAYAALETWMESHGLQSAGAPWESYVTDPAEYPDPKDWKTEIAWPVK
jgi:AraC family transcriptional regulator